MLDELHNACALIETTADQLKVGQVLIVGEGIAYEIMDVSPQYHTRQVHVYCRYMNYPFTLQDTQPVQAYDY